MHRYLSQQLWRELSTEKWKLNFHWVEKILVQPNCPGGIWSEIPEAQQSQCFWGTEGIRIQWLNSEAYIHCRSIANKNGHSRIKSMPGQPPTDEIGAMLWMEGVLAGAIGLPDVKRSPEPSRLAPALFFAFELPHKKLPTITWNHISSSLAPTSRYDGIAF